MAELLVRAKKHWMDDLSKEEVGRLSSQDMITYNARTRVGDIVVVRPDGWRWGREECLPNFLIVKLPGVSVNDVKTYTLPIYGEAQIDNSFRVKKEDWESSVEKARIISKNNFSVEPIAVPQSDGSYLVMGKSTETVVLRRRKHSIPEVWVKNKIFEKNDTVELATAESIQSFIDSITEKAV